MTFTFQDACHLLCAGFNTADLEKIMEPLLSQMSGGGQVNMGPLTAAVQASGLFSGYVGFHRFRVFGIVFTFQTHETTGGKSA